MPKVKYTRTRTRYALTHNLPSSLRAAAMEGKCLNQHAVMMKTNGWRWCPWCGMELKIIAHCETCGRDFFSESAFQVHNGGHIAFFAANRCPVATNHAVQYRKNRQKMYCVQCAKEFPIKEGHPFE